MEEHTGKVSKYSAVHVAARRARQLQSGSSPAIPTRSTKAIRIAQDELKAGLIDYVTPEEPGTKPPVIPDGYTPIFHS